MNAVELKRNEVQHWHVLCKMINYTLSTQVHSIGQTICEGDSSLG